MFVYLPQEPISSLRELLAVILRNDVDVTARNYDMQSQDINAGQEREVGRYYKIIGIPAS